MERELQDKLHEKYPKIFRDLGGDPTKTCMSWEHGGIACGPGWYDLLDRLCHFLQWNADKNGYSQVIADQVKEKFGELRFYYHMETPTDTENHTSMGEGIRGDGYLEGAISFAEIMSGSICEACGKPGTLTRGGWISCLCEDCRKK